MSNISQPQTFQEQITFIVGHLSLATSHIQAEEYDKAIASLNEAMEPFADNGMLKFKPANMDLNDFNNQISGILGNIDFAETCVQDREYGKASEHIEKTTGLAREVIEWFIRQTEQTKTDA